jgi:hypothetical protein
METKLRDKAPIISRCPMVERDWAFGISIKLPPQLEGRLLRPGGMEVIDEGILEFPKTLNAIWVVSKQTCHYS